MSAHLLSVNDWKKARQATEWYQTASNIYWIISSIFSIRGTIDSPAYSGHSTMKTTATTIIPPSRPRRVRARPN